MTQKHSKAEEGQVERARQLGPQRHGQRLDATKQSKASPQEEVEQAQHR